MSNVLITGETVDKDARVGARLITRDIRCRSSRAHARLRADWFRVRAE
jgi:hypothetical protein